MGKIIKGGVEHFFGGGFGGGSDIRVCTQEEYDALASEGNIEAGVYYFITDGNGEAGGTISIDVLDTMAEIKANTEEDKVAGALAVKELSNTVKGLVDTNSNTTAVRSSNNTSDERSQIRGYTHTSNGGVYLSYEHFPANSTDRDSLVTLRFDGTNFYADGKKVDANSVSKTLATIDDINSLKTSFQDGCSKVATAITEMGVTTASNATPDTMAANIKKIDTDVKHTIRVDGDNRNGYSYIYVDNEYVKLLNPYNSDTWSITI